MRRDCNRPYLSTRPCPTRYPKVSNRQNAASLWSSSSKELKLSCTGTINSPASLYDIGTISISRRSRQEELRNVACGSDARNGGRGVSKDIGVFCGESNNLVSSSLEELGSFKPAFFETRKCGKVFGKPFSGAEFVQRTLSRISDNPHSPDPRVWWMGIPGNGSWILYQIPKLT